MCLYVLKKLVNICYTSTLPIYINVVQYIEFLFHDQTIVFHCQTDLTLLTL